MEKVSRANQSKLGKCRYSNKNIAFLMEFDHIESIDIFNQKHCCRYEFYFTSWLISAFTSTNMVLDIFSAFNSCCQNCCINWSSISYFYFHNFTWYANKDLTKKESKFVSNEIFECSSLFEFTFNVREFTSINSFG